MSLVICFDSAPPPPQVVIDGGFMRGTDIVKARPLCLEPASGVALASVANHCRTGAVQKFVYYGLYG
jgi:hypothetical protein